MDSTYLVLYHILLQTGLHSRQNLIVSFVQIYSQFEIMEGIIIESTIEDNSQGQVTFLFYTYFGNGVIPGNVLPVLMEVS